jgi:hypothetical protein
MIARIKAKKRNMAKRKNEQTAVIFLILLQKFSVEIDKGIP